MTIQNRPEDTPVWASGGDKTNPGDTYANQGWPYAPSGPGPARKTFNWLLNWLSGGVRYLLQRGIPEWSATETYPANAVVVASDGKIYKTTDASTGEDPTTEPNWEIQGGDAVLSDLATGNTSGKGSDLVAANDIWAPTYAKTLSDIANGDEISLLRFIPTSKHAGIRAKTNTDDLTAYFQDAAAAANCIYVPFGWYYHSDGVTFNRSGQCWRGDGVNSTRLIDTSTDKTTFKILSNIAGTTISDMMIMRDLSVTPISGAKGIDTNTQLIGTSIFENLIVRNHQICIDVGPTDYSHMMKITADMATLSCVRIKTSSISSGCQWQLNNILAQKSDGYGFLVASTADAPSSSMTVGTFTNISSFATTNYGFAALGNPTVRIDGLRINGGFFGEAGTSNFHLDTYGSQHMFNSIYSEIAGTAQTGRLWSTPATNVGNGFEETANNMWTQYTGCKAHGNSYNGFKLAAVEKTVSGCESLNNGVAVVAGQRVGINNVAGEIAVSGSRSGNTGAGASQTYGIFGADGANMAISGCNLRRNTAGGYSATANPGSIQAAANLTT